jgi:hypothetical protein
MVSTIRDAKRIEFEETAPMSTSHEFRNIALLTALVVGVSLLSRLF